MAEMKTEQEKMIEKFIRWLEVNGMAIAHNHEGGSLTRIYLAEEREEVIRRFMEDTQEG